MYCCQLDLRTSGPVNLPEQKINPTGCNPKCGICEATLSFTGL